MPGTCNNCRSKINHLKPYEQKPKYHLISVISNNGVNQIMIVVSINHLVETYKLKYNSLSCKF